MRPTSKGIDVIAYSGTHPWSRIIQVRSLSRYSHVALVCEYNDELWAIESLERKGVRLVPLRAWAKWDGNVTAFRFKRDIVGDIQRQQIIDYAISKVGCEYASPIQFIRSFGFLTRRLCKTIGINADTDRDRYFCSEHTSDSIRHADLRIPSPPEMMTPGDVCDLEYLEKVATFRSKDCRKRQLFEVTK